ncbi:MAG: DsbA family protein [Hyphomicrobiaceae bacterium]|nr:DsbA family protein [Hyphomicrobiaceae bacterium]
MSGLLAASAGGLAGCAGGGSRPRAQAGPLNADGSPVLAELMKPGPLGEKSLGNPNAPTTIIEYASLTCPFCRKFHVNVYPRVKKELIDTGKVRWIVREFPIGRSAGTAAIVTRCAPAKDYFVLFDKFLKQQKVWVSQEVRPDAIYKVASQTGMTRQAFDACLNNKEIEEGLRTVKQRGRELGVTGTPTFFVNGKKKRGDLTYEELVAMIGPQTT